MAIRVDKLPKKSFNQDPMPHFPSWWLPSGVGNEINFSFSTKTNNVASESGSPSGNGSGAKPLGLQLMDHHDFSPTLSTGHSPRPHHDATGASVVNSQDQSYSSESGGQDDSCGRSIVQGQMKPVLLYSTNTTSDENMFSQPDHAHPMVQLPPYGLADPYLSGLLTAYGPHAIIQPQMGSQIAPNRVPLPLNLAEDGPIFVNAKQYHGILRRRQSRARLEAQNKLVKTRKPYLHESRHLHALNRVRGTGGRFLSTKKTQPPNMASQPYHGSGGDNHRFAPTTTCADIAGGSKGGLMYLNSDRTSSRVSGSMSSAVQRTGGLMFGASGHRSSSVR